MVEWLVAEIWGGGSGPPSILDLHAGSLSYKDKFVELGAFMKFKSLEFSRHQVEAYTSVLAAVRRLLASLFGVPQEALFHDLAFFSHINASKSAVTQHDEYWHSHVDTLQYGTFAYTALLYLSTQGEDFDGGTFIFENAGGGGGTAVEPRFGRLVVFTSDAENSHRVKKVSRGIRITMTVGFTCSAERAAALQPWPRAGREGARGGLGREGAAAEDEATEEDVRKAATGSADSAAASA